AARREAVAARTKVLTKLAEVVDLAVQDDRDGAVLVVDGLVAGLEIDHPKALDPETRRPGAVDSSRVRAAVLEAGAHRVEQRGLHRAAVTSHLSGDATHSRPAVAQLRAPAGLALLRAWGTAEPPSPAGGGASTIRRSHGKACSTLFGGSHP